MEFLSIIIGYYKDLKNSGLIHDSRKGFGQETLTYFRFVLLNPGFPVKKDSICEIQ